MTQRQEIGDKRCGSGIERGAEIRAGDMCRLSSCGIDAYVMAVVDEWAMLRLWKHRRPEVYHVQQLERVEMLGSKEDEISYPDPIDTMVMDFRVYGIGSVYGQGEDLGMKSTANPINGFAARSKGTTNK